MGTTVNKHQKKGFTLVEVIVVLGVIIIVVPALFAIVFAMLQEQAKIFHLSQVKKQGDFTLAVMENVIKSNAVAIHNSQDLTTNTRVCNSSGTQYGPINGSAFVFEDKNHNLFYFDNTNDIAGDTLIASSSSIPNASGNLTDKSVYITNFTWSCSRNSTYSSPLITVSFTMCYNTSISGTPTCSSSRPEDTATMNYTGYIKLRNS